MPKGSKHQSRKTTKLLNLGSPGSGKTGALACLLRAGYRLIILDFDNGLDILTGLLRNEPEALDRLYYETFTDQMQMTNGVIITKGKPVAFSNAMKALNKWKFPVEEGSAETYDLGDINEWGPETVLVIDSLGFASEAALRLVRQENQHQFEKYVSQPDYGQAMSMIEHMLELLYSDSVKCNVIVNTHLILVEDVLKGSPTGMPRALGSKLPPKVGGYFNSIVRTMTEGVGKSSKKVIRTASDTTVELKLPVPPGTVPETVPIENGLLTIFNSLRDSEWVEVLERKEA